MNQIHTRPVLYVPHLQKMRKQLLMIIGRPVGGATCSSALITAFNTPVITPHVKPTCATGRTKRPNGRKLLRPGITMKRPMSD